MNSINTLALLFAILIFFLIYRSQKKAIEKPSGKFFQDTEEKIAEAFFYTRDFAFQGLVIGNSAYEGKLILTNNNRLLYTTFNEKKCALVLESYNILNINLEKSGKFSKQPAISIEYIHPRKKKTKVATFTFLEKVDASSGFLFSKDYQSPKSLDSFYNVLAVWRNEDNNDQKNGYEVS
ncbi:MAG: hypothetical protein KAJ18_06930 [Candidatus Omnitrophica bacterium]|nr:hypothetical protein [Candidatus Omnitrophota bacterium]